MPSNTTSMSRRTKNLLYFDHILMEEAKEPHIFLTDHKCRPSHFPNVKPFSPNQALFLKASTFPKLSLFPKPILFLPIPVPQLMPSSQSQNLFPKPSPQDFPPRQAGIPIPQAFSNKPSRYTDSPSLSPSQAGIPIPQAKPPSRYTDSPSLSPKPSRYTDSPSQAGIPIPQAKPVYRFPKPFPQAKPVYRFPKPSRYAKPQALFLLRSANRHQSSSPLRS
ncbi:extensin-like [Penaeus monodon]|uniref:extensin-like n=1 Tax=Penaeus monodon TaxID=6687 RepID=UPI0018A7BE39|nr:extensin-like [Penaeus monodon]